MFLNYVSILHQSSFHHIYQKIIEKVKFDAKRISDILLFELMTTKYFFQLKTKKKLDKSSRCGLPLYCNHEFFISFIAIA